MPAFTDCIFRVLLAWTPVLSDMWLTCGICSVLSLICVLFKDISSSQSRHFSFDEAWFTNSFFHGVYLMVSHLARFHLISNHKDLLTPTQGCVCEHSGRFILMTERGEQPRCPWTQKCVRNIHKAECYSGQKGCVLTGPTWRSYRESAKTAQLRWFVHGGTCCKPRRK